MWRDPLKPPLSRNRLCSHCDYFCCLSEVPGAHLCDGLPWQQSKTILPAEDDRTGYFPASCHYHFRMRSRRRTQLHGDNNSNNTKKRKRTAVTACGCVKHSVCICISLPGVQSQEIIWWIDFHNMAWVACSMPASKCHAALPARCGSDKCSQQIHHLSDMQHKAVYNTQCRTCIVNMTLKGCVRVVGHFEFYFESLPCGCRLHLSWVCEINHLHSVYISLHMEKSIVCWLFSVLKGDLVWNLQYSIGIGKAFGLDCL